MARQLTVAQAQQEADAMQAERRFLQPDVQHQTVVPMPARRRKKRAVAPSGPGGAPFGSDIALAAVFAQQARQRLRWSGGLEWMRNDGPRWVTDDTLVRYTLAKGVCTEQAAVPGLEPGLQRSMTSSKTVNAVLTLARDADGIATPAAAWDRNPMLLNTPAGGYDLETGKPIATSGELFTQLAGAAPDFTMATPIWLRFLHQIFGGDEALIEFIQRWGGYCLTGDRREQKIVFWYGTGANGKSVLEAVLRNVAGTYALNLPSEVLMRQQHQQHPTELAQLRGKRLAISSELEDGAYWAESRLKSLTGDATLTARFMRADFFEFAMTQKHIVLGNFRPRLKGDDPAIARRMLLVPFLQRFTGAQCDRTLPLKLRGEYPGILAWFIAGAVKWACDGLQIPRSVEDASAEYLAAHDDIGLWIEERCITDAAHRTSASALYANFSQWKEASGERAQSMTAWGSRMTLRYRPYRTMHGRGYEGIALLASADSADQYRSRRGGA